MKNLRIEQIGVCTWSLRPSDPSDLLRKVEATNLRHVQLALDPLRRNPDTWGEAPRQLRDAGIEIVSGMFGTIGEDYATPATIRKTGGVLPDEHWPANWQNIQQIAEIAAGLGLQPVSSHAGFIPDDEADPAFGRLVERIRAIADLFAERFDGEYLMETGQETADTLNRFLDAVDRPNVAVNFDPANMLLYGMGDPVEAARALLPRIRQVHIKDAVPPDQPDAWGRETPVGAGAVDWPAFLTVLGGAGYDGCLVVEREGGEDRVDDVTTAVRLLCNLMEHSA